MNILNVKIIKHKKFRFEYLGFIGFEYTLPVFIDTSIDIGQVVIDMQRVFIVTIAGYFESRGGTCVPITPIDTPYDLKYIAIDYELNCNRQYLFLQIF